MTARATLLLAAVAAACAGCGIDRRSPEFACETTDECPEGRVCDQGWCVVGSPPDGGGVADAPAPVADADPTTPDTGAPDALICPAACSRCELGVCIMDCSVAGSCAAIVVCPPDLPCKVECGGDSSCAGGVDCSAARSCRIECTNTNACAGAITCGAGVCRVECGGANSCGAGVSCATSCQCDTFCTGAGACLIPPTCPAAPQCDTGVDCTGIPGPCNTC